MELKIIKHSRAFFSGFERAGTWIPRVGVQVGTVILTVSGFQAGPIGISRRGLCFWIVVTGVLDLAS